MKSVLPLTTILALGGAGVAFLLRPADIFGHQLPLATILTRGSELQGINRLLVPLARESFNDLIAGVIIGAMLGIILGAVRRR